MMLVYWMVDASVEQELGNDVSATVYAARKAKFVE